MENSKFKQLIKETYKLWEQPNSSIVGIIYGAISSTGFSEIKDIDSYLNIGNSDMLYLKSKVTDDIIDIYKWELEDYKIKHSQNMLFIKLKEKQEIGLMF